MCPDTQGVHVNAGSMCSCALLSQEDAGVHSYAPYHRGKHGCWVEVQPGTMTVEWLCVLDTKAGVACAATHPNTREHEMQGDRAPCCLVELGCGVAVHPDSGGISGCRANIYPKTRNTRVQGDSAARHPAIRGRGVPVHPVACSGGESLQPDSGRQAAGGGGHPVPGGSGQGCGAAGLRRGHHPHPRADLGKGGEGAGLGAHDLEGHPERVALPAPREGRGPGPSAPRASGAPFPVRKRRGGGGEVGLRGGARGGASGVGCVSSPPRRPSPARLTPSGLT